MATITPVILSGGSGTRLWPRSRSMYPKQFIRFLNDQETSFLGATLRRLPADEGFGAPILSCNNDHRFLIKEELESAGIEAQAIVLEPAARNTAPAIAAAALIAMKNDPEAILAVMPSDHIIGNETAFRESILAAAKVAESGRLVLFGITPSDANTGYGYIRRGATFADFNGVFHVDAFFEKPDKKTAEQYLASGDYFWNSGIFVLRAGTFINELANLEPGILKAATAAVQNAETDLGFLRLEAKAFATAPNISIDYAVMEKTDRAAMLPIDVGWNDVGSWSSLWDVAPHDADDNYVNGNAVTEGTHGCFIHSDKPIVATLGVENLIIVDTPDALLVADRARAQDVSGVVKRLKDEGRKEHEQHIRNYRPWGFFETLSLAPRFQVKKLHVKPGGKLSMQMHHHRSEHWIVVQGTARVVIGDRESLVRENESVYIVATQWHRLENPGKVPLELIEVQMGSYLGEDDIIRSDDIYKRSAEETK